MLRFTHTMPHHIFCLAALVVDTHAGAAVNWDEHLSAEGVAREPPTLRIIASRYTGIPGVIGLHGGFPAAEAFPITQLSYTLRDGTSVSIDDPAKASDLPAAWRP